MYLQVSNPAIHANALQAIPTIVEKQEVLNGRGQVIRYGSGTSAGSYFYKEKIPGERRYKTRRIPGGTTSWSHKAIADTLAMRKAKVIASIDLLLDNGFIQHEGFMSSSNGSKHRIYRVVHPEMIETVRAVMPILPSLPSETAKRLSNSKSRSFMCSAGDADWDPDSPDTLE